MGSFKRDLEISKKAVDVIKTAHEKLGYEVRELTKAEQINGDLEMSLAGVKTTHEVKFDIMAGKTGNLCFETHNGKGAGTGMTTTKALYVDYVVPKDNKMTIFQFRTDSLRNYLFNEGRTHKVVQGGDGRKFTMILVPIDKIIEDTVAEQVYSAEI